MAERLIDKLRELLVSAEGREVTLRQLRDELRLEPGSRSWESIRMSMKLLERQKVVKASGRSDGVYKVLRPIKPVSFSLNGDDKEGILEDFKFPRSYIDDTTFGIEDLIEVFVGDVILITGVSNQGKSVIAYNMMGRNLGLMPSVLMGSECVSSSEGIAPKLKRRLRRMDWVDWTDDEGKVRFELLPVQSDYEDYVRAGWQNYIDWISLPGEYYLIDKVTKTIKDAVGRGIAVVVIQKKRGEEYGEGGERSERYADVVLKIDPFGDNQSLLTLGRVKSSKTRATGRTWAFEVVDHGANLQNIREVIRCKKCYGKGWSQGRPCDWCDKLGYVNKDAQEV